MSNKYGIKKTIRANYDTCVIPLNIDVHVCNVDIRYNMYISLKKIKKNIKICHDFMYLIDSVNQNTEYST